MLFLKIPLLELLDGRSLIYYSCLFLRNSFSKLCDSEEKIRAMYKDWSWRKGQLFIVFYTYDSWFLFSFTVKTNLVVQLMAASSSCVILRSWRIHSEHFSQCAFAVMVKMVRFSHTDRCPMLEYALCENRDTALSEVAHNESLYGICMILMTAFSFRQSVFP